MKAEHEVILDRIEVIWIRDNDCDFISTLAPKSLIDEYKIGLYSTYKSIKIDCKDAAATTTPI